MHYLKDLEKVVKINSFTGNKKGVDEVGYIFDKWFEDIGFSVDVHQREDVGAHRHYRSNHIKGAKKLLLLGHLDTVFPPNKFENYSEDSEWIYGAGVCDMKGGNIVAVEALRRVFNENIDICNIDVLFVSDEETGSDDSKILTAELALEYDYCFVYEAAGENMEVVTGRKGVGTFFINIEGKAAHAGNNYTNGCDANLEAAYKLQELVKLTDLDKGTTVNVGKIEGGIGANTVSPNSLLTFEVRYKTTQERDRILEAINNIVQKSYVKGTQSILSGGIQRDVMQTTDRSINLVKSIGNITSSKLNYEERGGVSDANIVSSRGVVTLDGFGPFGDGDHTIYERANKKSFEQRIELSKKLFKHFVENFEF